MSRAYENSPRRSQSLKGRGFTVNGTQEFACSTNNLPVTKTWNSVPTGVDRPFVYAFSITAVKFAFSSSDWAISMPS